MTIFYLSIILFTIFFDNVFVVAQAARTGSYYVNLMPKRQYEDYHFVKTEYEEKWLEEFKKTFLNRLRMSKPPKIPKHRYLNKTEVLEGLPDELKERLAESQPFQNTFVPGEGFDASFNGVPVLTYFFQPHKLVAAERIQKIELVLRTQQDECDRAAFELYELKQDAGNAHNLRDETKLLQHFQMIENLNSGHLQNLGISNVHRDHKTISYDLTAEWPRWLNEMREAKLKEKEFYKGFIMICKDCICDKQPVKKDNAQFVIKYRQFERKNQKQINFKDLDNEDREKYINSFAPKIYNNCRKVGFTGLCCTKRVLVSMETLGWEDWIIFPPALTPNVCSGRCNHYNIHVKDLGRVLTNVVRSQKQHDQLIGSCCSPKKFASQIIIYQDEDGEINTVEYPDFSVVDCGCT